jgi:hypothetical protein
MEPTLTTVIIGFADVRKRIKPDLFDALRISAYPIVCI